jgi:LacI family transcriptional regulator
MHLMEPLRVAEIRRWLADWDGNGVIARVKTDAIAQVLLERGLPVVNVTGACANSKWPTVDTDNEAVCKLAAAHLIERGYRHFAYCGMANYEWSGWRRDFFAAELARQNAACSVLELPSLTAETGISQKDERLLNRWVAELPQPVGILACNDHCGQFVLQACGEADLSVPDQVGVMGVDNDGLICELCLPPLSSVEVNCERIGYIAAETLDLLMHGERAGERLRLIKPTSIANRRSTDSGAVRDPTISEAIRFIRTYACEDIGIPQIAHHVGVSRRYLELQFRRTVGRSIHSEITRIRLETAQRFLGETDWKLQTIAERSGFKQAAHMSGVFQKTFGLRPGQYRRNVQNRD